MEDNWSSKVQKRNAKISALEGELKSLTRKIDTPNQVEAAPPEKKPGDSAAFAGAEKKDTTLREQMKKGSKKYITLLEEKPVWRRS